MKKTTFIVIILFLVKPIFPLVDYVINYDYISKVLCENKTKPQLKCNGKCYLMKQLSQSSTSEKSVPTEKKENSSEKDVLYFEGICNVCELSFIHKEMPIFNIFYLNLYSFFNTQMLFRPPAC